MVGRDRKCGLCQVGMTRLSVLYSNRTLKTTNQQNITDESVIGVSEVREIFMKGRDELKRE